jgi:hypothetical protein
MANQNVMLGFPNRIDESSLSGGSWLAALPLANLKNRTLGKLARSTDLAPASTWLKMDLGAPRKIRALDLRNHNLSAGAKVRIRASNELPATNYLKNNTMQGAVVGGAGPSFWPLSASNNGITRTVSGVGSEGGIPYVDFTFSGTATARAWFWMNTQDGTSIPAAAGQRWAGSVYSKIVAGARPTACYWIISGRSGTGQAVEDSALVTLANESIAKPLSDCRIANVMTMTNANTAFVMQFLTVMIEAGESANVTVRVGLPQLERDKVTSPIPTSGAMATRAAGDMNDWYPYDYDSGWVDAWPIVYPYGALEWEDDNWWSRQYSDEERTGYTAGRTHVLPADVLAQYWRVDIADPLNPAGFVQLGRVFIGPAWQPSNNMSRGASLSWETGTEVQEAYSGAEFFGVKTPYRVARFSLDWLTESEGLSQAFELHRRAGIDKEVLFIFDPTDTIHALRRQFLGRLRQLSPIEFPYATVTKNAFEIKENL